MVASILKRGFCVFPILASIICSNTVSVTAQTKCNGYTELCSRRYSNVSQIGSHDSAFVGTSVVDNQHLDVTTQLNRGIRFLTIQTHNDNNVIEACHTSCALLNAGTLQSYLTTVKTWMDASNNTNEVVTILIVNNDDLAPSAFNTVFTAAGINNYAYSPSGTLSLDQWPTLQDLITSGKRLVVFMDYQADTSSVSYILPEFTYFFETPYDVSNTDDFSKCAIDRPSGSSATGKMYIVNHFLDQDLAGILIPDQGAAGTTNSEQSIMSQSTVCEGLYGRAPKAVLVDWMDQGNVFAAERDLNGITS